jgi:hypothetical protein
MAALPINDQIMDRYFQSDDDDSDFEGFSEVGSDVDILNALDSSEDEQGDDDSESEIDDFEMWKFTTSQNVQDQCFQTVLMWKLLLQRVTLT